MKENGGQRIPSIWLPVTMAQHTDAGLHFNESFFRRSKMEMAFQKKTGESLNVSAAQTPARHKTIGLRILHRLILIEGDERS